MHNTRPLAKLLGGFGALLALSLSSCQASPKPSPTPDAPVNSERPSPPNTPAQAVPTISGQGHQITTAGPAGPLTPFFQKLGQLRTTSPTRQAVTILHVGDSHVASDTMTAEVRDRFQKAWGEAGRGYIYAGRPWKSYRQEDVSYDMRGAWQVENGMSRKANGPFGVGGIKISTSKAGDYITRTAVESKPFDHIEVHYLSAPKGGQFKVLINDQEQATVSTALAPTQEGGVEVGVYQLALTEGAHTLKIEAVGDGEITLLGTHTQSKNSGVIYHSLGLNGARAQTFLSFDEALTVQEVSRLQPDLFILGFGTNEAYNLRNTELTEQHTKTHQAQLTALIQRYKKASPQAACLVLLPMEFALKPVAKTCYKRQKVKRGRRWRWEQELIEDIDLAQYPECAWTTPPSLEQIRLASINAAKQEGCAIWDQLEAMGGVGSFRRWATLDEPLSGQDGVHLRLSGYRQLGQQLYVDLIAAYQRWETTSDATLETTPWQPPPQAPEQP